MRVNTWKCKVKDGAAGALGRPLAQPPLSRDPPFLTRDVLPLPSTRWQESLGLGFLGGSRPGQGPWIGRLHLIGETGHVLY